MALVGDLILEPRLLGPPDPPQTLAPPTSTQVVFSAVSTGAGQTSLPTGNYFLEATYTNSFLGGGQTKPGLEQEINIGANQVISVTGNLLAANGVKVYIGTSSGTEGVWVSSSTLPFTIQGGSLVGYPIGFQPGAPPQSNSAWLPDTDGAFAPASLVYGWLNSALREAGKLGGGIPDVTGAPSVLSQNTYTIPGVWRSFTDAWYDGYEIFLGTRNDNWYQSQIQTLAWNAIVQQWSSACSVEIFPQAQRTSGVGTLSSQILSTDNVANVTYGATGFSVPVGLMLIGTLGGAVGTYEIVTYTGFTSSPSQVTGLARGFGGTTAQTWPTNTPIYELNIRFSGRRYPRTNSVGDSALSVDIPHEWIDPVKAKVLAKYKRAEHENQEAAELEAFFTAQITQYSKMNDIRTGRKQMGGQGGVIVYFPTQFHGVIVP